MRVYSLCAASLLFLSDTLRHSPTRAGIGGLRHKYGLGISRRKCDRERWQTSQATGLMSCVTSTRTRINSRGQAVSTCTDTTK